MATRTGATKKGTITYRWNRVYKEPAGSVERKDAFAPALPSPPFLPCMSSSYSYLSLQSLRESAVIGLSFALSIVTTKNEFLIW